MVRTALAFLFVAAATAAHAVTGTAYADTGATSVDAPGDLFLFALGIGGVLIGRKLHRRRNRRDG